MNPINYNTMSKKELKAYFLKHRGDQLALQAYLERLNQQSLEIIAEYNDPNFEEKVRQSIQKMINSMNNE
jgi:hypothetical protein